MDVARPTIFGKGKALSSVKRKTSCSSGWLRLLVQGIFATITVASFILILIMAIKNPGPKPKPNPEVQPRCHILSCRVICMEAPYFGEHVDEIIFAVSEADKICSRVTLELRKPSFVNNTLPDSWLSRMRCNVYQLEIIGGNLKHIPSGAFMSQFTGSVRILVIQNIKIETWESTSLVGLSSLRNLNILNSYLESVDENALRAVDDTLQTLTVTESGDWDPINFTGFTGLKKLTIVNFSYNNFNQILNKRSFVGLDMTKILYLNSCRITAIGAGAFDHLTSIEVLYLNNNMLSTVPPGLFNAIVALENPKPRINLQDNFWLCDCSVDDLRQLIRKDILLVEAKCTYPEEMNFKTFTQFEDFCNNNSMNNTLYKFTDSVDYSNLDETRFYPDPVYVNGSYCSSRNRKDSVQLITPVHNNVCSSTRFRRLNVTQLIEQVRKFPADNNNSDWIQEFYFLRTKTYSVVQIEATKKTEKSGLIWYESTCPHEIYCLDVIPTSLRIYNIHPNAHYTFCPVNVTNASIENRSCIDFSVHENKSSHDDYQAIRVILYMTTVLVCCCFGAVVVYGLIRRKPTLLKGSKRILFVKHKHVDALVLPPKVPLKNDLTDVIDSKDKEIFTLTTDRKLKPPNVERMKSVRSNKSGSPSYISAMQPTDDQLAEWRIRHHFNNDLTISSVKSELSALSWTDTSYYYSLDEYDRTYESLK